MADSSLSPASFWTQANALLRKNVTYQKRNIKTNIRLISFPFIICLLLVLLQGFINSQLIRLQILVAHALVLTQREMENVRKLFLAGNMIKAASFNLNASDVVDSLATNVVGSDAYPLTNNFLDPAFFSGVPIYNVQSRCSSNSTLSVSFEELSINVQQEVSCVQGLPLWRNSSSEINNELYKGYRKGNSENKINEFTAVFNVSIWYNSTYREGSGQPSLALVRVPRSVNLVSNAYLQFLRGPDTHMIFEFVKEMPKPHQTKMRLDLSSLLGTLFFTWVVLQLFPVILTSLVYEKQQKLRIMMKMHGLGDGPYWMISYAYFLLISLVYMLSFVIFGSVIGLKFFTLNDNSLQFVFYFIYVNLQISLAFLVAAMFSNVTTSAVVGYICVFGTGLLGDFLFKFVVQDASFPRGWIIAMELYPGFSLYRGLYEFAQASFTGNLLETFGMQWGDSSDSVNGMREVLIIMVVEWFVVLFIAYYIDQVVSSGSGKSPLFFLRNFGKKPSSFLRPSLQRQRSKVFVQLDKPDVSQEREKVEQLLLEPSSSHAIVVDDIKKVYPGKDGNPAKFAARGLSLALPRGECFGMLGPNGVGKTSFISMPTSGTAYVHGLDIRTDMDGIYTSMGVCPQHELSVHLGKLLLDGSYLIILRQTEEKVLALTEPTSGTAYVHGLDIRTDMDGIYTSMGVCPQHDLLWETLTGREHLLFYGRLKNLKGSALTEAVEESLKSVNLFNEGLLTSKLVNIVEVVYMDEPSTGLDPASRNNLWNVVKRAKQDRAIILTTHSMEEAEVLCDRLGIFVDGSLQCIGNPKELKARYGGSYVFTMTTSSDHEQDVEIMVRHLSPQANKIYHISGTQKFEVPKHEIRIADVFRAVENAKSRFTVFAWGLADTTLEDVFIKVARGAQAFNVLS
ncbi:ABC transporter A family member 7 [Morella rubra]|uniref:ABC transporter A family member 7 n=1 Tax=Morella rubra TaxID=262757 RepID=A0A6A1VUQ0_9ROSI|nr:ABC transporter A family member 7 [Morella rubra]